MTAEIIPFGEQQRSRKPVEKQLPSPPRRYQALLERERNELADLERQRKIKEKAVAVRCKVDGRLFEVIFHRGSVWKVRGVSHRIQKGRIVEYKKSYWDDSLEAEIIAAAQRELSRSDTERSRLNHDTSIAQLWERHAQLLRDAERVKATIALMEREVRP